MTKEHHDLHLYRFDNFPYRILPVGISITLSVLARYRQLILAQHWINICMINIYIYAAHAHYLNLISVKTHRLTKFDQQRCTGAKLRRVSLKIIVQHLKLLLGHLGSNIYSPSLTTRLIFMIFTLFNERYLTMFNGDLLSDRTYLRS